MYNTKCSIKNKNNNSVNILFIPMNSYKQKLQQIPFRMVFNFCFQ